MHICTVDSFITKKLEKELVSKAIEVFFFLIWDILNMILTRINRIFYLANIFKFPALEFVKPTKGSNNDFKWLK